MASVEFINSSGANVTVVGNETRTGDQTITGNVTAGGLTGSNLSVPGVVTLRPGGATIGNTVGGFISTDGGILVNAGSGVRSTGFFELTAGTGHSTYSAASSNSEVRIIGNRSAADANPDVAFNSTVTRTSGSLVGFLNGGNAIMDLRSSGVLRLSGTLDVLDITRTRRTIGAAGGASALPATPLGYLDVVVSGNMTVSVPYFIRG